MESSDTVPMATQTDAVWPSALMEALAAAHCPGRRLAAVSRLAGGVSADVFRLDFAEGQGGTRSAVLRVHGARHNGHSAALESAILRAVHDLGLCVPRVLVLDESLEHLPHPFLLLDHIDGEKMVPASAADPRIEAMARMLARIHALPVDRLPDLPPRIDPVPEILAYLPDDGEFDAVRLNLARTGNQPCMGPPVLLHGDFWPGNLLWRGEELVGILDWEDAALGEPLSDVAGAALELSYVAGMEGADAFVRAYAAVRPVDPARLALWQIYVAAAGHHSMGAWGLEAEREAHMRATALSFIRQAMKLAF